MVTVTVQGSMLTVEVLGSDRLWCLRRRLEFPLEHVRAVRAAPGTGRGWLDGLKLAGTFLPGVLTAGTFLQDGRVVFWDVRDPGQAIVIDLTLERYQQLIVEVADPAAAVRLIEDALARE